MIEQINHNPFKFISETKDKEKTRKKTEITELIAEKISDINLLNKLLKKNTNKKDILNLLHYIDENKLSNSDTIKIVKTLLKNKSGKIRARALEFLHKYNIVNNNDLYKNYFAKNKDKKTKAEAIKLLSNNNNSLTLHNQFKYLLEIDNSDIVKIAALKAIGKNFRYDDFDQVTTIARTSKNQKLKYYSLKILIKNIDIFDRFQQSQIENLLSRFINKKNINTKTKKTVIKELEKLVGKIININNYTETLKLVMEKRNEDIGLRKLAAKKYFFQQKNKLKEKKNYKKLQKIKPYIDKLFKNERNIYSEQNDQLFKIKNSASFERLLQIYKKALTRRKRIAQQIKEKGENQINSELLFEFKNDKSYKLRKKIIKHLIKNNKLDKLNELKDSNLEIQALIENPNLIFAKNTKTQNKQEKRINNLNPYNDYEKLLEIIHTKGKKDQAKAIELLRKNDSKKVNRDLINIYQKKLDTDIKILILKTLANRAGEEINQLLDKEIKNTSNQKIKNEINDIIELRLINFL